MTTGAVNAGAVEVRVGADFDDAGFDQYERALERARAQKAVETQLGGDFDPQAFNAYDKAVAAAEAKAKRRDAYKAALGGDFDARAFNAMEREMAKARASAARDVQAHLTADVDQAPFERFKRLVSGARQDAGFLERNIGELKWPALISGAGSALSAVTALTGGVAALTAGLAPASGALAAYPTLASAAAQGMGTFKLATAGIVDVVGGLNDELDETSDEFKALTPEARRFARELDSLKGPLRQLQRDAQQRLLPGLSEGLDAARGSLPEFKDLVAGTADVLGDLAREAGEMVGSDAWGRDIATQGERNARWIKLLGEAGLDGADALRNLIIAAGPLVNWMVKGVAAAADWAEKQAEAGRKTGELRDFFASTRDTLEPLVSMVGHFASGLYEVGKAGKPLGDDILKDLDAAAARFEKWTKSAQGRNDLEAYFDGVKEPLYETVGLIGDVLEMFGRLSSQDAGRDGFLQMVHALREDLLPTLEEVIGSTSEAFGPEFIELLENGLRLLGQLAGSSGPLVLYVELLSDAAGFLADLLEQNPALKTMVTTWLGLVSAFKALNLARAISGVDALGLSFKKTTAQAEALAATQAGGVGTAGAVAAARTGMAGMLGKLAPVAKRIGLVGLGFGLIDGIAEAFGDNGRQRNVLDRAQDFFHGLSLGLVPKSTGRSFMDAALGDSDLAEEMLARLAKLKNADDPAGLKQLSADIRNVADQFDQAAPEAAAAFRKIADQSDRAAENIRDDWADAQHAMNMRSAKGIVIGQLEDLRRAAKRNLDAVKDAAKDNLGEIRRLMERDPQAGAKAAVGSFRGFVRTLGDLLKDGKITSEDYLEAIEDAAKTHGEGSAEAIGKNFGIARDAIKGAMDDGKVSVRDGMGAIRDTGRAAAQQFSAAAVQVQNDVAAAIQRVTALRTALQVMQDVLTTARQAREELGRPTPRAATGRRSFFVDAPSRQDSALYWLGRDEAVVNVHHQDVIDRMLPAGMTVNSIIAGLPRPNWAAKGKPGKGGGKVAYSAVGRLQQRIDDLERAYGQRDRAFSMSDEEILVEHEDGSVTSDPKALHKRGDELNELYQMRGEIGQKIRQLRDVAHTLVKRYRDMIKRFNAQLKGVREAKDAITGKGDKAAKRRDQKDNEIRRLQDKIGKYRDRSDELGTLAHDLGFDLRDNNLDRRDLQNEAALYGIKLKGRGKGPGYSDQVPGVHGADPADPADADTGGATTAAPSAADIAAAAAQQLAAFQAGRADLFSQFGSNFASSVASAFGDSTDQAAGMRFFGAGTSGDMSPQAFADAMAPMLGERQVNVNMQYATGPEDPLIYSRNLRAELAAIG